MTTDNRPMGQKKESRNQPTHINQKLIYGNTGEQWWKNGLSIKLDSHIEKQ